MAVLRIMTPQGGFGKYMCTLKGVLGVYVCRLCRPCCVEQKKGGLPPESVADFKTLVEFFPLLLLGSFYYIPFFANPNTRKVNDAFSLTGDTPPRCPPDGSARATGASSVKFLWRWLRGRPVTEKAQAVAGIS